MSENLETVIRTTTSQNMPLLSARGGPEPISESGEDLLIIGNHALQPDVGPSGTLADLQLASFKGMISVYTVREGDSLSLIGQMFGVSVNTILWANNLSRSTPLKVGQELVILPVSGVRHTVKKGDTLASITKEYKADLQDILSYNGLSESTALAVGDVVIVPDGVLAAPVVSVPRATSALRGTSQTVYEGYYLRPVAGARRTQGLHGYNGIDLGAPVGTAVMAAAAGDVIVSRASGYNGGYGKYVVIRHANGTQTLYSHLNATLVSVGDYVNQGQLIGTVGSTGRSTGPHLHFEVRGAKNPF